jgi:hypothetical protein
MWNSFPDVVSPLQLSSLIVARLRALTTRLSREKHWENARNPHGMIHSENNGSTG